MKAHRECPSCKKSNHVRVKECKCGYEFNFKAAKEVKESLLSLPAPKENISKDIESSDYRYILPKDYNPGYNVSRIIVPGGRMIVQLKSLDQNDIESWAKETAEKLWAKGRIVYSLGAYVYLVNAHFPSYDFPTAKDCATKVLENLCS